jgi:hypothetical protein
MSSPDKGDTPTLRAFMEKIGKSDPRSSRQIMHGSLQAFGDFAGGARGGDSTSVMKIKVNFVPVEDLQIIKGIGSKMASRMHLLRLTKGNLTPLILAGEFGKKMTESMLDQMDFVKNDMLVDRDSAFRLPSMSSHRGLERDNCSDMGEEEEDEDYMSHRSSGNRRRHKHSKRHNRHTRRKPKSRHYLSSDEDTSEDSETDVSYKSGKKHGRKHIASSSSSSDESGANIPSLKKMPRGFDKTLHFDGLTDGRGDDFDSFKFKFKSYARAFDWSEEECRYCLCWSLQGPAAKYHTLISSGKGPLTYKQLMKKLEKRFGGEELVETAQARFNQACQEPRETLEVWADRIQMLAMKAFKQLPESYAASQAVNRFCLGLDDREASKDACLKRFKTMDEAKDYVHYFLHISNANVKTKSSRRTSSRDQEEQVNVYEASISQDDFRKEIQKLQSYFDKKISMISKSNCNQRQSGYGRGRNFQQNRNQNDYRTYQQSNRGQYNYNQNNSSRGRGDWGRPAQGRGARNWNNGAWNRPTQETGGNDNRGSNTGLNECYHCGEAGHIRSDCKKWLATQECFICHKFGHRKFTCPTLRVNQSTNNVNLNEPGSGEGAELDS